MSRVDSDRGRPAPRVPWLVVVLIALTICASCGSPSKDIALSAETAASSVHSVQLVLETLDDGKVTTTAAQVSVTDALTELSSAQSQLDAVAVTDAAQARTQAMTSTTIADAVSAVRAAQDALEGFAGAPSTGAALAGVKKAATRLDAAAEQTGRPR